MDPQERLFLQCCWETLEDAGYTRARVAEQHGGRVGVFAGVTRSEFSLYGPQLWAEGKDPGTSFCSLANRVSYVLDLNGPSLPIDTMCSSSLVAVHEACAQLLRAECEMAFAGGVNLSLHEHIYTSLSAKRMLSPDGRCKSFGAGGNGYVPGEGVGVVLLKPLDRALEDGDRIHAVIRGSCVNHGGKTHGYTVPSPIRQGEVIRKALDRAGVDARALSYIEAHGTGTELGDPIEITGLNRAFRADTEDREFCAIGSVKSNIGHLEAASGIAGLIKVVLQMQHRMLVPTQHADELNPNIDFEDSPFVVNTRLQEWTPRVVEGVEQPRLAGVSSFGAGGTNAHVVLEEYPEVSRDRTEVPAEVVITLSARKPQALREYAQRLLDHVRDPQVRARGIELGALAHTLQRGREPMKERLAVVASGVDDLDTKLQAFVDGRESIAGLVVGTAKSNPTEVM